MKELMRASSSVSSSSEDDDYVATPEDVMDIEENVDQDSDSYCPEVLQNLTIDDDDLETKSNPDPPIKRRFEQSFSWYLLSGWHFFIRCSEKTAS